MVHTMMIGDHLPEIAYKAIARWRGENMLRDGEQW